MELILQVIFSAVFSGLALSLAIPNELYLFGFPFFTLIAFIPLYLVFPKLKNWKMSFWLFFLQTLITHLISSFWLAYFKDFAAFTLGASAFGTACIGGAFGICFYLPYYTSFAHNKLNESTLRLPLFYTPAFRILYFAALYTLYEWVKSRGFLGYPWGTVSSAMFRWPLIMQTASFTGTYGITFVTVLLNGVAAEYIIYYYDTQKTKLSRENRFFNLLCITKVLAAFIALMLIHGLYQYDKVRKPIKELTVVTVQQNSDPWKSDSDEENILRSQRLTQEKIDSLNFEKRKADLVVWSEGCLTRPFPSASYYYTHFPKERPLVDFVKDIKVPFIFGGSSIKTQNGRRYYYNAALLFDSHGNYRGFYGKNHLVPFAECIPFSEVPAVHNFMEKVVGISAGWTPGDQYVFFDIPCRITEDYVLPAVKSINLSQTYSEQKKEEEKPYTVRISTPICFDDAFTDIMRPLFLNGTELFINITDDSWSLKKSSEIQHFVIASYRAIEYRTTLIRSANAGYSVVVDPAGKVVADLPLFEDAAMDYEVPVYKREMTTYARFGNWLPYLLLIFFTVCAVYSYLTFCPYDYIPSERKIHKHKKSKKKQKKNSKNKK